MPTFDEDVVVNGAVRARDGLRSDTGDWELARNGEHLEIREPEQSDKVWVRFNDDRSVHLIGTPDLRVDGTVGVGTTTPRTDLHVVGRMASGLDFESAGAMTFFPPDGFAWFHIDNGPSGGRPIGRLRISHGNQPGAFEIVNILQNGNVGIGTDDPRARLHVDGDIRTTGDIILENADCAEEFDLDGDLAADPGAVVVLGRHGAVMPSAEPYDRRVAGVVSGAGSYQPGVILDRRDDREDRIPVAVMGKVYCQVDATDNGVSIGDPLTTSATPGHAMKAADHGRAFGAVLGKAMEPLSSGYGLIPVLVALQ